MAREPANRSARNQFPMFTSRQPLDDELRFVERNSRPAIEGQIH
jgi:hypothetical protein